MDKKEKMISLIVPVYNEEEVLPQSFERMNEVMQTLNYDYEIIYVDDGSSDQTWNILKEICAKNDKVRARHFSRNFGHQPAVSAGIDVAKGDALVIIDVDLQDPPSVIPEMVKKWEEGYEVVYGKRLKRHGESIMKKFTAHCYYRLLKMMSAYPIPLDTGDFRLIDKKVADVLRSMKEKNRFLRGMAAWAGFKTCPVEYVREERAAGQTHYTMKKMLGLAMNGILGFSHTPLLMPMYMGGLLLLLCLLGAIVCGVCAIFISVTVWLWVLWVAMFFLSLLLICMGFQGAYIARIFDEVLDRPLYVISEDIGVY